MKKVAVIGAGISGLTIANLLKDKYIVKVYEKESIPGGLISCKEINGGLFHTCGGHVFNSKRQDVLNWFWSFLIERQNLLKCLVILLFSWKMELNSLIRLKIMLICLMRR